MTIITLNNIDRKEDIDVNIDDLRNIYEFKLKMINHPVIPLLVSDDLKATDYIHIVFENDEYRKLLNEYKGEDDDEEVSILGCKHGDIINYNLEGWHTYQFIDPEGNRSYYIIDDNYKNTVEEHLISALHILDDKQYLHIKYYYYFKSYLKYYCHIYKDGMICITVFESDISLSFGHKRIPPVEGMLGMKRDKIFLGKWGDDCLINEALSHLYTQRLNFNTKNINDIQRNVFYFLKWKAVVKLSRK